MGMYKILRHSKTVIGGDSAVINSPGSHNSLENRDSIPNLKKNMMIMMLC